jgi:hypothetical protein
VSGIENQLRDLLEAAVGEPPRRVTVEAVRRRMIRRRVGEALSVTAVAVVVAGIALATAFWLPGAGPSSGPRRGFPPNAAPPAPKVTPSASSGVQKLPPVGAPGYPAAIYPAAVRAHRGALAACPATVGLVRPPSSARARAIAIIDRWATLNRTTALHASDRAIWPEILLNMSASRAHGRRPKEPILYAGLLKAEHRYFGGGSPGAPDPSGFIRFSCGITTGTALIDKSYLVVAGTQSEPALQEDWVFVDRAGHLLLYFIYP